MGTTGDPHPPASTGMTASNDAIVEGAAEPNSVGALLRAAREAQGLSPGDIATKLRMAVRQIAALEQSDFAALPTGTFLRGFVRNYAKALGLNPDQTLALLEKTQPAAVAVKATQTVAPDLQNIRVSVSEGFSSGRMRALAVGAVVVALLAACWYWWVNVRPYLGDGGRAPVLPGAQVVPLPTAPPSATTGTTDAVLQPAASSPPIDARIEVAASQPSAASVAVAEPTSAVVSPAEKPVMALAPGENVLGFTFDGDSWVEVIDGAGKTVLSRRFHAGEAEEARGRPPFKVTIGSAKATRMAYNGKEWDLIPFTREAVARVTVK